MNPFIQTAVLAALLLFVPALRTEAGESSGEGVPKTYEESGDAFKEGGRELGEGFRGIGRGIKNTFTGKRSKEEYEKGAEIGEGFKDVGRGVAGGGRATGRAVKEGVTDDD